MPIRKPMFVVPLSLGTIATGNEASGFPASNLGETDAAGLVWKSSGATNVWARGNLGSAQSINFATLISGGNLHAIVWARPLRVFHGGFMTGAFKSWR